MGQFISFICPSCEMAQLDQVAIPFNLPYLSGSICDHCRQIISTETKCKQIDDASFAGASPLDVVPGLFELAITHTSHLI